MFSEMSKTILLQMQFILQAPGALNKADYQPQQPKCGKIRKRCLAGIESARKKGSGRNLKSLSVCER